ncbi:centromere protein T isoform X7 [Castor canadensis]|uniref:Centromere protein T isoform X7 n=1 Tax=Castor canadensis TaxID=51338 RepID=A0AC58L432_CASCN
MADFYSSDSELTTRTLLRRVLDTADSLTPRRRRSAQAGAQKTLLETPSSRRLRSQTETTARQRSHGARSIGRLAHGQASGSLEEKTPRTLLRNILLTAPESSIVMPDSVVKPVSAPQVVQSSRRKSSRGSLELQLPELEPPSTLAPGLPALGRRKQRLRLSVFQQEVNQELPLSQEPSGNADASALTSSLNLTFATPLQPQSVRRPGLARRPPTRRAVDVGALLQDLRDNSLASGNSHRTPAAALPTDTVLEDTQPFSQPLVGCSPSLHDSLPLPTHTAVEDSERAVGHRTRSRGPRLQNHKLYPWPTTSQEVTEGEGFREAEVAKELEGSSGDEDTSDRPSKRPIAEITCPELASSTPEFLQAKQPHEFLDPTPSLGVTILDKYFQHLCNDLEVFAAHAGRKTVRPEDLELLMRRQGLVTDQVSLHVLVERHLPLEYRQLLIPCAFSGNSVFPAQ